MLKRVSKVYFCKGLVPTNKEKAKAAELGITSFCSSPHVDGCRVGVTAIAGTIPQCYLDAGFKPLYVDKGEEPVAPAPAPVKKA